MKNEAKPYTSIIIPTFNGIKTITSVLSSVFAQKYEKKYEVIVIDSESTDGTLNELKKFNIKLISIPNKNFNHGGTRNLGAKIANGEILVYLTQDAVPANESWLYNLTKHFRSHDLIACVFGPQIARKDADLLTNWELHQHFNNFIYGNVEYTLQGINIPAQLIEHGKLPKYEESAYQWYYFNSDVNSAIRKTFWQKHNFPEINYAEDQVMGKSVIVSGHLKVFDHNAAVYHSHDYSYTQYFRRQFDEYRALKLLGLYDPSATPRLYMTTQWNEFRYKLSIIKKLSPSLFTKYLFHLIIQAIIKVIVVLLLIKNLQHIPASLQQRFSLENRANFFN